IYVDGTTTMSTHERKASIREFYDIEREEYGICMEVNSKIVLPNCIHAMCLKRYREWRTKSQSCPFCHDSLKRVNSCDLWVFTDSHQSMMNHMSLLLGLYELISAKEAVINGGAEIKGLIALVNFDTLLCITDKPLFYGLS
ncbi:hypothetical protein S83_047437, partial [Arachis hypogaea]